MADDICKSLSYIVGRHNAAAPFYITSEYSVLGTGQISTDFRLDTSLCDIITALILFFIIGCEFFINYKINFRKREKGADKE